MRRSGSSGRQPAEAAGAELDRRLRPVGPNYRRADAPRRRCRRQVRRRRSALDQCSELPHPHIATEDLESAKADLAAAGFEWDVPNIRRGAIACTGIEFCNLAITETKLKIKEVVGYLEKVTPNPYERGLKINMNGCPNSCAQHHVGDIGLQGCLARLEDGSQVEAYDVLLGGDLGHTRRSPAPFTAKFRPKRSNTPWVMSLPASRKPGRATSGSPSGRIATPTKNSMRS